MRGLFFTILESISGFNKANFEDFLSTASSYFQTDIMTDIFKLIFEHDIRLDDLRARHTDRDSQEVSSSIEAFLKPDPTYSKFYITGTLLPDQKFGLNCLQHYQEVIKSLSKSLTEYHPFLNGSKITLENAVENAEIGTPVILSKNETHLWDVEKLRITDDNNIGHFKSNIAELLTANDLLLYKEKAHQGFDLHLLSKINIYPLLFATIKPLASESFRFFSINGRRIRSERTFYFETWTLHKPPHGAEEVFPETIL